MHTVRGILVKLNRSVSASINQKVGFVSQLYPHNIKDQKYGVTLQLSVAFSSYRGNDGYHDDLDFLPQSSHKEKFDRDRHDHYPSRGRPSYYSKRHRAPYRDEFEDFSDYGEERRSSRFDRSNRSSGLGANLKQREWRDDLPPIEKNFYVESQSVTHKSDSEIAAFYDTHNITVSKGERPLPISDFAEANFPEHINTHLAKLGWRHPTPIQSMGWPLALSGKNIVAIAQTGSGKTLGFILPALIHIKHQRQVARGEGPIALVLAPTRELAQQIKHVAVQYGSLLGIRSCAVFGGQSKNIQGRHLSEGPELVVATPGRLLDFLESGVVNLDRSSYLVLDEADRMLDMGFEPQIRKILSQIRPDRQTLMWSATWPREIQQLASDFLGDFTQINIGTTELSANPNITQTVRVCEFRDKFDILLSELEAHREQTGGQIKTLIFAQTKFQADTITHKLRKMRFQALAIHGDKSQLVRDKTLDSFRNGRTEILVATDVASRGLDVNDIQLVINYDYPNDADSYVHRIGRTGRAEKKGKALTFITDRDSGQVADLIKVLQDAKQEVPQDLADLARLNSNFKRKGSQSRPNYNRQSSFNRRPHSHRQHSSDHWRDSW